MSPCVKCWLNFIYNKIESHDETESDESKIHNYHNQRKAKTQRAAKLTYLEGVRLSAFSLRNSAVRKVLKSHLSDPFSGNLYF